MSTRYYPRYVRGNPQLRVFLPDWKLVMLKPNKRLPNNIVSFKTDPRMTDWDIKNYLEKIYNVKVMGIRSKIWDGALRNTLAGLSKHDNYKVAHVTLPAGQTFNWPDLFPQDKIKEEISDYERTIQELNKNRKVDQNQKGLPSWFA